jgi:hypothetical protein
VLVRTGGLEEDAYDAYLRVFDVYAYAFCNMLKLSVERVCCCPVDAVSAVVVSRSGRRDRRCWSRVRAGACLL